MLEMATCGLETWLSVKILITEFQALDPAIPALDGVKLQVPSCCDSNRQLVEPHQVLCSASFPQEGGMEQSVCAKALVMLYSNCQTPFS